MQQWIWVWPALAAAGQVILVAVYVRFARAHPTSRIPLWTAPTEMTLKSRIVLGVGSGLTIFGMWMLANAGSHTPVFALLFVAAFTPVLVSTWIINRRAATRRAATAPAVDPANPVGDAPAA